MHLTHICPRFKEVHGGGEPVLLQLFHHLSNLGIRNTVHTYNFPASMRPLMDPRVRLKELPRIANRSFNNVLLAGFYDLFCSMFLGARVAKDTDVVCFHTENVVPALFLYNVFRDRKPVFYFCFQPPRFAYDTAEESAHAGGGLGKMLPLFKAIYRPFDKFSVRQSNKIATFSNGYKSWIESIYNVRDVAVIPPGVEIPQNNYKLPENILHALSRSKAQSLIFVGKLVTWKNVDRLLEITALINKRIPNIFLLIVGDGPCKDSLVQQAKKLGIEHNTIFCGYVAGEHVFSFCREADLLVLLEKNASFGLSLIEANATGLPVMALEGGGPSDIVQDGMNGFLVQEDVSDEQIAEIIIDYLTDEKKMQRMRKKALQISGKFTWPRFAELFAEAAGNLKTLNPLNR
jgi:glycosyltransferase involved in cell wall biosynthesis